MLIRNDDVSVDLDFKDFKRFCELCDKYNHQIIQAITPYGTCIDIEASMTNEQIKISPALLTDNKELVNYLKQRKDIIGVHGLWHTHSPSKDEIQVAKEVLDSLGLKATYFIPPFNEGNWPNKVCELIVSQMDLHRGERLEDFLDSGLPEPEIVYCHSWRFPRWYPWEKLENLFKRYDENLRNNASLSGNR